MFLIKDQFYTKLKTLTPLKAAGNLLFSPKNLAQVINSTTLTKLKAVVIDIHYFWI